MDGELKRLIEGNERTAEEIITYGCLPLSGEDPKDGLVRVVSEEFHDLADLRAFLRGIYTEEETERLLADGNVGGPQYIEKEGGLWYDIQWMVGGAPSPWKSYTAEPDVLPQDADAADITVHVVFDTYREEEEPEETGTYHLRAVRTAEGWRLSRMEDRPDEWLISYEDEEAAGEETPEAVEEA